MSSLKSVSIIFASLVAVSLANQVMVDIYWITPAHFQEKVQLKFESSLSSFATKSCSKVNSTSCGILQGQNLTAVVLTVVQSETSTSDTTLTVTVGDGTDYLSKTATETIIKANRAQLNTDTGRLINRVGTQLFHKDADPNNWVIVAVIIILTFVLLGVVVYLSKHKVDHHAEHLEMEVEDEDDDKVNTNL